MAERGQPVHAGASSDTYLILTVQHCRNPQY